MKLRGKEFRTAYSNMDADSMHTLVQEYPSQRPENRQPLATNASPISSDVNSNSGAVSVTLDIQQPIDSKFQKYHLAHLEQTTKGVEWFNKTYPKLPAAKVIVSECGVANAFYIRAERTIKLCYEFDHYISQSIAVDLPKLVAVSGGRVPERAYMAFVFLHEVGHLLADGRPTMGREEDVADQIAVMHMHPKTFATAALVVTVIHKAKAPSLAQYSDSHTVDGARGANLVCWMYGKSPVEFAGLEDVFSKFVVTKARLRGCAEEYTKIKTGAAVLVKPYR